MKSFELSFTQPIKSEVKINPNEPLAFVSRVTWGFLLWFEVTRH